MLKSRLYAFSDTQLHSHFNIHLFRPDLNEFVGLCYGLVAAGFVEPVSSLAKVESVYRLGYVDARDVVLLLLRIPDLKNTSRFCL